MARYNPVRSIWDASWLYPLKVQQAVPTTCLNIPLTCRTGLYLLRFPQGFLATFQGSTHPDSTSLDIYPRKPFYLDLPAAGGLSGNLSRPGRLD
jgi:hypothetical protein